MNDINFDILKGLTLICYKRPENNPNLSIYFYISDTFKALPRVLLSLFICRGGW